MYFVVFAVVACVRQSENAWVQDAGTAQTFTWVFFFCQGRISLLRTKILLTEWFSIECRKLFRVWFGFASQRSLIGSKKS